MTRPILTVACRAGELVETLSESVRQAVHQQLDELIAGSERCPYVLTEAAERLIDDTEPMLSAERDTREEEPPVLIHDDDCGARLDADGLCPFCGFCPDMQSVAIVRPVQSAERPGGGT